MWLDKAERPSLPPSHDRQERPSGTLPEAHHAVSFGMIRASCGNTSLRDQRQELLQRTQAFMKETQVQAIRCQHERYALVSNLVYSASALRRSCCSREPNFAGQCRVCALRCCASITAAVYSQRRNAACAPTPASPAWVLLCVSEQGARTITLTHSLPHRN